MSYELPVWSERIAPSLQVGDRQIATDDAVYSKEVRQLAGNPENQDFVDWLNEYRIPVHEQASSIAKGRLENRGAPVEKIAEAIAQMTETPKWPTNRLYLLGHAKVSREFKEAARNVSPELRIMRMDAITVRYHALLGVATVNDTHTPEDYTGSTSRLIGDIIAQAAIGNTVSVLIERGDDMPQYKFWYGYQWWDKSERYGGAIQKSATDKLAVLACQANGVFVQGKPAPHPMLEPYRLQDGYYFDSGFTLALDTIHQKLGYKPHEAGVYDPIWEFGKSGGDERPREVLANMVSHATSSQISLEDLEVAQPAREGMHLNLLQRVEEACGVDVSRRVSTALLYMGIEETKG